MRPTSRLSLALYASGLTTGCHSGARMMMDAALGVIRGASRSLGVELPDWTGDRSIAADSDPLGASVGHV